MECATSFKVTGVRAVSYTHLDVYKRQVTDSNSGISQTQAKEMGIYVVPMPFLINGKEYLDGIDLFPDEFYKMCIRDRVRCVVPSLLMRRSTSTV